ncbi:MAG: hypothetical protein Q7R57_04355 [Dehalococcoidales bacterium]|nr:hypothetical protein [Dehalococcoidales bacterium]
MINKYTHLELDKEQHFLPGYYVPTKEVKLKYDGREVLYVVGQAAIESSCCAAGNFAYVIVPGFIVNWQKEKGLDGLPVSDVEPVSSKAAQRSIRKIIRDTEHIEHIEFW